MSTDCTDVHQYCGCQLRNKIWSSGRERRIVEASACLRHPTSTWRRSSFFDQVNHEERLQQIIASGFCTLSHAWYSKHFTLQSFFSNVAGKRSIACGTFRGFFSSIPHPLLCTLNQSNRCLSCRVRGRSWLGCQVLPAYGAVFTLELAATSGCSRMSHAPNLALNYKLGSKMFLHNFKKMTQSVLFGWQPCKERKTNELSSEWPWSQSLHGRPLTSWRRSIFRSH